VSVSGELELLAPVLGAVHLGIQRRTFRLRLSSIAGMPRLALKPVDSAGEHSLEMSGKVRGETNLVWIGARLTVMRVRSRIGMWGRVLCTGGGVG
jgi:hypothetical protein